MKKKISLAVLLLFVVLLFAAYKLWFTDKKLSREIRIVTEDRPKVKGMVFIPGASFIMGSNKVLPDGKKDKMVRENELPEHKVEMIGFFIDKYEVTNAEYKSFTDASGNKAILVDPVNKKGVYNWKDGEFPAGEGENPVVLVNWNDAKAYCEWAGKRLPTEQEWEMACKGSELRKWSFGNKAVSGYANTRELKLKWSKKIGSFPEDISSYGLFDMAGNVMEWTSSWYLPYPGSDMRDSAFGKTRKILRGGGWITGLHAARCTSRTLASVPKRHRSVGFRCARDIR